MQVPIRSYLTAGMSFVAVGAIIATPMSPLEPKQVPNHRLAGDQQVHLAALRCAVVAVEHRSLVHHSHGGMRLRAI